MYLAAPVRLIENCHHLPDHWISSLIHDLEKKDGFLMTHAGERYSSPHTITESIVDDLLKKIELKDFESAGVRAFYHLLCNQKQLFLCKKSTTH